MQLLWTRSRAVAPAISLAMAQLLGAADHGAVFGLATPTNPKGGWSFDLDVNGRSGTASNLEAELTYGLTQNIKLAVSGPLVFQADPYPRSSVTTNTPISGDFSGLTWWRFQKKDFAGKRIESTAVVGVLAPAHNRKPASTRTEQRAGLHGRGDDRHCVSKPVRVGGSQLPTLRGIQGGPLP